MEGDSGIERMWLTIVSNLAIFKRDVPSPTANVKVSATGADSEMPVGSINR